MALASNVQIEIDGKELKDFLHFTISQSIYDFHEFEVICRMDAFENANGFIMEQSKKMIGSIITIAVEAYLKDKSSGPNLLLKGIITGIKAEKSDIGADDHIVLSGCSPDILMSDVPHCESYEDKNLHQIVKAVVKPYPTNVLKCNIDTAKRDVLPYTVQYNENRYDFIRRLAIRYGEWFFYDGTQVYFGKLPNTESNLKLGIDLNDIDFAIQIRANKSNLAAFDYSSGKSIEANTANNEGKNMQNEYGAYAFDQSSKQYSQASVNYYNHLNAPVSNYQKELDHVASLKKGATALHMSLVNGSSQNPQLKPGSTVTIKALKQGGDGEVDYGKYIITELIHRCDNLMNYQNHFEGIPAESTIPDYTNPDAIPYSEAQSARVTKLDSDPQGQHRVQVQFYWGGKTWCRLIQPYSSSTFGTFIIPEMDDEVLVGFEGGNAEKPYIIGSLYSTNNSPPYELTAENNIKAIITRSNLKIEFDDDKKTTTIETPGGNTVLLSDDDKSILLQDQNNNKVKLSSDGIKLDSPTDINISSKAKVIIKASSGVDISSTADAKVSGMNINLNANASISAKGNGSAELSSVGNTTVKGSMVMIN